MDSDEDAESEEAQEEEISAEHQNLDADRYYSANWKVGWVENASRPATWSIDRVHLSYGDYFVVTHRAPTSFLRPSRVIWYPFQILR